MERARQSLKQSTDNLTDAKKRLEAIVRAGLKSQKRVQLLESLLAMQTTIRDRAAKLRERKAAEAARTAASTAAAETDVIDIVGYGSDDEAPRRRVASRTELNEQDYEGKFALKVHSFQLPATCYLMPATLLPCYLATLLPCYLATLLPDSRYLATLLSDTRYLLLPG